MSSPAGARRYAGAAVVALTLALGAAGPARAVMFTFTPTGNAAADAGFQSAAAFLADLFFDPVTVNVTTGFTALPANVLGQASSQRGTIAYTGAAGALALDATSGADAVAVAGLPAGATFDPYINRTADNPAGAGSATPYVDADGGSNNATIRMTTANAKALGLLAADASIEDARITFSNLFTWDFDPGDGIDPGAIDFVGVAVHELMHAMGFISGVDVLDANGSGPYFDDDQFTFVSILDLYRHSADSVSAGADFDWTADARSKYFSIDGGLTNLTPGPAGGWSTGVDLGDGRQASHWKDGLGLGIMDPTSVPAGQANVFTSLDLLAMDVIGWDTVRVSAPASWTLLLAGLAVAAGRRRPGRGRAAGA